MKQYFQLLDDLDIVDRWHLGSATLADGSEPHLITGSRLDGTSPLRIPITHPGHPTDFCLTSFAVPIAGRGLAATMHRLAGADIQLVDIENHEGLAVLNVLRLLSCVDESRSEFLKWTVQAHRPDLAGQYRQITHLVLEDAAIPSQSNIFRIAGFPVKMIVSESMRSAMEEAGCVGAKFVEVGVSSAPASPRRVHGL